MEAGARGPVRRGAARRNVALRWRAGLQTGPWRAGLKVGPSESLQMRSQALPIRAGFLAATLLTCTSAAMQSPDTSAKAVARAASRYLIDYEQRLSFLLADEQATQRVFGSGGRETARRTMSGELFVTFLAADRAWISVHDTSEVDGRALDDREDLARLLGREPIAGAARRLADRNARFNIGGITRNFNEPTLGLLVLEAKRIDQFTFSRTRVEQQGDAVVVTLRFKEADPPTLVHGADGRDLFSSGELQIDAGTGRIRRTSIHFAYGPVNADLTTTYAREPKLDVWVPSVFEERYERTKGTRETVVCESIYRNYRKFEVKVIVK